MNQEKFFKTITHSNILRGKPKIFIIQACRTIDHTEVSNVLVERGRNLLSFVEEAETESREGFLKTLPRRSRDVYILYSATPGYYSWKDEVKGSWFIQAVCDVISQCAHLPGYHLIELYGEIRKYVNDKFELQRDFIELPHGQSTMNKKFHFFPGWPDLCLVQEATSAAEATF